MEGRHVFLSYCRDNRRQVSRLHKDIVVAGFPVWRDTEILPGSDWRCTISEALAESFAVIVCLSLEVQNRRRTGLYPEIRDAIGVFRELPPDSIYLLPVRLSCCDIPRIPIDATRTLADLQYVDLFPRSKWKAGLDKLLRSLATARKPSSQNALARPVTEVTLRSLLAGITYASAQDNISVALSIADGASIVDVIDSLLDCLADASERAALCFALSFVKIPASVALLQKVVRDEREDPLVRTVAREAAEEFNVGE